MFSLKKIGTVALSFATVGLMFQGSAFAEANLTGSGEDGAFTPGLSDPNNNRNGSWNDGITGNPTADDDLEVNYSAMSSANVNSLDNYTIKMTIPTSVSFTVETYSPDADGVVTIDSSTNPAIESLGKITNDSYGILERTEKRVDAVVSVVSYEDTTTGTKLKGGLDFVIYGDGNEEISLIKPVLNESGSGFERNEYLGADKPSTQLAVVAGAFNANPQNEEEKGSEFDINYRFQVHLGDPNEADTISHQLKNVDGKSLTESGDLTLHYAFQVGESRTN